MSPDEEILVVPRAVLLAGEPLQGFHAGEIDRFSSRIRRQRLFRRRTDVEDDPAYKQIIPYLILRHQARIFLFQRLGGGREERLHGLYSIGVGGHIGAGDVNGGEDPLRVGLERELREEVVMSGGWSARPVGVLNDETNAVSRVHFGVVYVVEVEHGDLRVREADRLRGALAGPADVRAAKTRMETWSQLILSTADPFAL